MPGELNLTNQFRLLDSQIEKNEKSILDMIALLKQLNSEMARGQATQQKNTQAATKLNSTQKQLTATEREMLSIKKQSERVAAKSAVALSKEAQELNKSKIALQQKQRAAKQMATQNNQLLGQYKRQSARLNTLRQRYKDVALSMGQNSKQAQQLQRRIQTLDTRLKKVDASAGQFGRKVGDYPSAFNKAGQAMKGFIASAVGVTVVLSGIVRGIRGAIQTTIDFESANSELAGVLSTTRSGVSALTKEAERLGGVTAKSASEVTALQTAYARLGFSQQEIIDMTENTIFASVGMNAELDATAELGGAIVKMFNDFSSTDAPKIMDVLAKSTTESGLSFEKLAVSVPKVGKAADSMNIPFETMISHLAIAQDATQDASVAGTSMRKIYSTLAKEGMTLNEALNQINTSTTKTKTAIELFGDRAFGTALALADSTDRAKELNTTFQDVQGTAQAMHDEQLDNLQGDLTLLSSAWESFNLTVTKTGGMRKAVQGLTSVITFLTESVRKLRTEGGILAAAWKAIFVAIRLNFQILGAFFKMFFIEPVRLVTDLFGLLFQKISNGFDKIKKPFQFVGGLFQDHIIDPIDKAIDGLGVVGKVIEKLAQPFKKIGQTAKAFIEKNFGGINEIFKDSAERQKENAKGLAGAFTDAFNDISDAYKGTGEDIEDIQDGIAANAEANADKIIAANQKVNDEWGKSFKKRQEMLDKVFEKHNKEYENLFEKEKSLADLYNELDQAGQDIFAQAEKEQAESMQSIRDDIDETAEKETEATRQKLENIEKEKQARRELTGLGVDLSNQLFEFGSVQRDKELADIEAKVEAGVLSEEAGAQKKKQIMREEARAEKIQAIFNAIINVAEAVTKFGVITPQAILAGIVGGAKVATIASRPVPSFYKGVENFEGGPAEVGEKGYELVNVPGKGSFLTPDFATIMNLPRGSDVVPHHETKQILSESMNDYYFKQMLAEQRKMNKRSKREPKVIHNITKGGYEYIHESNGQRTKWIDKYVN